MKAVVFHEHGGLEVLRYEDRPEPAPGPGQIAVRVKACALNHLDIWIRQGIPAYQVPLPHISGCDVAGIVAAVGANATGIAVGDRVFLSPGLSCWRCEYCLAGRDNFCVDYRVLGAQVDGGYAEVVVAPAVNALSIPAGLSFEEAAAFPLVTLTAWHMLYGLAEVKPGETVLAMAAGSGVGSMAVQLAKLAGARVLTTVGSDAKMAAAAALGADVVINHTREDVAKRVKEATDGRGADVVIEHIGPDVWAACMASLTRGGRLITCGATTGREVPLDLRHMYARQLTIRGSYLGTRAELAKAAALIGERRLRAVVDQVLPLREARAAQQLMLDRKVFGKLVLAV
jgi:NADPH:quinone reductase-like Zn-dependent oxidoreductase